MARCEPATAREGVLELGKCMILVAPAAMTKGDRKEWLSVAMETLSGIPADLLVEGCAEARKRCRFLNEIVPTIMETVGARWRRRIADQRRESTPVLPQPASFSGPTVDPAEIQALIKSLRLKADR